MCRLMRALYQFGITIIIIPKDNNIYCCKEGHQDDDIDNWGKNTSWIPGILQYKTV